MIAVTAANPRAPDCVRLLEASQSLMTALFPSESNHYLSIDKLSGPDIRFFAARRDGETIGCGALAIRPGYGEVKSMFTDEMARGHGVAAAVLKKLIEAARAEGLPLLRLETGDALHAAHRLYARHGFVERGPFGVYTADPNSLFMEKKL